MIRILFTLLNFALSISCIAQIKINSNGTISGQLLVDEQGIEYFKNGIISLENGRFFEADSLFSLSLCTYKHEDVYYNRAITKILLKDTIGYCSDLRISAHLFFDKNAAKIFNETCCTNVDTTYYDKKGFPCDKNKYSYLDEILVLKYEKDTIGFIHHKYKRSSTAIRDYDCDHALNNLSFRNTDIVGSYSVQSGDTLYNMAITPPELDLNFNYDDILNRFKIVFANKYSNLKNANNEEIILGAEFNIDKAGLISNIKLVQTIPIINDEKIRLEMENDLANMIQRFPNFKPAKMYNKNINYVTYYQFSF